MSEPFLDKVIVIELGERLAVGLCGGLLARLGAEVRCIDPADAPPDAACKTGHRRVLNTGKASLTVADDLGPAQAWLEQADIVVCSSDWQAAVHATLAPTAQRRPIVCDITAFGTQSGMPPPLAGAVTDTMVQAFAGVMDTTGFPDGAPLACEAPVLECSAAVFATAGILAALQGRDADRPARQIDIALFDAAVSMLTTFIPTHFTGGAPRRMGNRHPSMAPWNAYPARDGWVLLCSASDDMWSRVCGVIGQPALAADPRFLRMAGRVANADAADALIAPWIAAHDIAECVRVFSAASVPCGPVATVGQLLADTNLQARGGIEYVAHGATDAPLAVPGRLFHGEPIRRPASGTVVSSAPGSERSTVRSSTHGGAAAGVLDGLRVVEMGSYTTAPLAARNLGMLGAYVVKAEPPGGELSRASPPYQDGQSYLCTMSNTDKRAFAVDLRMADGRKRFSELLSHADVFVENMKPGALARFGFSRDRIEALNPRLIYCSVSGYGAGSPLADLPAMDTTIQGAAGLMAMTADAGRPCKVGVSVADLLGGQFGLAAILAGLAYRDRTGCGRYIDLSMQELTAWVTQFHWNPATPPAGTGRTVRCADGFVLIIDADPAEAASADRPSISADDVVTPTRAQTIATLAARGIRCAPVQSVGEVATDGLTAARGLIVTTHTRNGQPWPALACPIRMAPGMPAIRWALGAVDSDRDEVVRDWTLADGGSPP
jgi:crotonobetainyl-CoA:carnitine CoA-transferase CaiB-like acyl-CoA transferase